MTSSLSAFDGNIDCPCIDTTLHVSHLDNCDYGGQNDTAGFWQYTAGKNGPGSCYPLTYGSSLCAAHDHEADPFCRSDNPPSYCQQEWCFVDAAKCKNSDQLYYKAKIPSFGDQDLFYSYSTCNSTNDAWQQFLTTNQVAGKTLTVTFPAIWKPGHYKDSNISDDGQQHYYDDSVPWKGWVIDYLEAILAVSNIEAFNYTYRSIGSKALSQSKYTAAVSDVGAGISDVVASSLWITSERLAMTPFTTQTASDKVYLWVPSPVITESHYIKKVLEPFDPLLWLSLFFAIVAVSLLSLWFATPTSSHRIWWQQQRCAKWEQASTPRRIFLNLRVFFDAFVAYATFFFGQTVEYDITSSYPDKILNFGYGFLILIAVASYTANLAAFLTLAGVSSYIDSMESAVAGKVVICGPIALRRDLTQVWPRARFEFYESPDVDMFGRFDSGRCGAFVGSEWDFRQSEEVINGFCAREIVNTKSLALEIPLGFAINANYAAGLSYWMEQAAKNGTTFASFEAATRPPLSCSLDVPNVESDELVSLTPANFALPFLVFFACAILASVCHMLQRRRERWVKTMLDKVKSIDEDGNLPGEETVLARNHQAAESRPSMGRETLVRGERGLDSGTTGSTTSLHFESTMDKLHNEDDEEKSVGQHGDQAPRRKHSNHQEYFLRGVPMSTLAEIDFSTPHVGHWAHQVTAPPSSQQKSISNTFGADLVQIPELGRSKSVDAGYYQYAREEKYHNHIMLETIQDVRANQARLYSLVVMMMQEQKSRHQNEMNHDKKEQNAAPPMHYK